VLHYTSSDGCRPVQGASPTPDEVGTGMFTQPLSDMAALRLAMPPIIQASKSTTCEATVFRRVVILHPNHYGVGSRFARKRRSAASAAARVLSDASLSAIHSFNSFTAWSARPRRSTARAAPTSPSAARGSLGK